jgi:hypothetical protein
MTTTVKVNTNGSYVADVKITNSRGEQVDSVGPGSMVEKSFSIPHGEATTIEINEREATPEEVEAAK